MGKDNRVKLDEFDEEEIVGSSKNKSAANIRAELEKKQREKRLKNSESKNRHQPDPSFEKDD
ncbi:hypothetical protein [Paraglaciecola arctica]|uniref:Uncharacterized protein n=1 Tax=Paraglaciecola arctica BSs20135 TaxID=493475 RepID=K6YIA2_9ALTE|nr:hypothetical protein [Paraglaciecola arctica]GAC17897.1 hypothetical protein GARC_0916 [Paraglaciecola arctica BSs20135]